MIKRFISIALTLIILISLSACNKENESSFGEDLKGTPEPYSAVYYAPETPLSDDEMFSYINQMEDLVNRISTSGCDKDTLYALGQTGDMLRSYRYEDSTLAPLMGCCGDIIKKILNLHYRIYDVQAIYALYNQYTELLKQLPEQYTEGLDTLSRRTLNMAMLASYLSGQADYDQSSLTLAGGISFTTRGDGVTFDRTWASIGKFPGYPLQNMQPVFFSDMYTSVACNTIITDNKLKEENKKFNRATSEYINIFKDQSIACVVTETPHMMDFGEEGKMLTQNLISNNALNPIPMGMAFDALNFESDAGIRILSADFTDKESDQETINSVLNTINYCKTDGRLIAVYICWDTTDGVTKQQKVLAHTLINAGADIIIGLSDGEIEGIEKIGEKYIFYNIGQLVNGNNASLSVEKSLAVRIVADKEGKSKQSTITSVTVIPFYHYSNDGDNNNYQPTPIFEKELQSTVQDIIKKSSEFENGITSIDYFNPVE